MITAHVCLGIVNACVRCLNPTVCACVCECECVCGVCVCVCVHVFVQALERTLEFEEELAKQFGEDESAGGDGGKEQQHQQSPAKPSSLHASSTDVSATDLIDMQGC